VAADINEDPLKNGLKGELPRPYVQRIALAKMVALASQYPDSFIITADTTVAVGRRILGKAADMAEAEKFLTLLSGRNHDVITCVVVRAPNGQQTSRLVASRVKVKRLHQTEIASYLAGSEWQGKAGAYAMQGTFAQYIHQIIGSPSGIIGLPLYETAQMLKGLGFNS
jgi:septum formation protein